MKERARVVELKDSVARVKLEVARACPSCEAKPFCMGSASDRILEADNHIGAGLGDEVWIETRTSIGIASVFILFGLPVLLGLVGLFAGSRYSETHSVILGLLGFGLGLMIAKIVNGIVSKSGKFMPRVIEIVKSKY